MIVICCGQQWIRSKCPLSELEMEIAADFVFCHHFGVSIDEYSVSEIKTFFFWGDQQRNIATHKKKL